MRYRLVLLALLFPLAGACSGSSDTSSATQSSAPAGGGAVGIANFKFAPPTVNVPVGGSVVWTNNDTQQHTATSSGNFDAGAIQPAAAQTYVYAGGALSTSALRSAIMTIGGVEARHAAVLRMAALAQAPLDVFPGERGFCPVTTRWPVSTEP
jgi:plastocyanin